MKIILQRIATIRGSAWYVVSHPTTLHGGKGIAVANNCSMMENTAVCMCIVPVQLWHKDNVNERIIVYALLDDCSQATFIHQDIIEKINMPKRKTTISVKTLHGEQKDNVIAVSGLFVKCVTNHSKWYPESNIAIELPCTYSRPFIAAEPEDIPTPTKIY